MSLGGEPRRVDMTGRINPKTAGDLVIGDIFLLGITPVSIIFTEPNKGTDAIFHLRPLDPLFEDTNTIILRIPKQIPLQTIDMETWEEAYFVRRLTGILGE